MRPKYSTGYLTPQSSKNKNAAQLRRTGSNQNLSIGNDLGDSFFEKLMTCPLKRQLVLNIINSEKDNIEEYKRQVSKEEKRKVNNASPLLKIKRDYQCESPTALLRRRVLEQQNRQNVLHECLEENQANHSSRSSSRQSIASSCPSPIPFNKLLDEVVAYVEIKSKGQDRSSGAKALMTSMGATVTDKFTKDVTHVIFKDGSFTTYEKAKLMKVHLVSVLWIEAVRSNNMRVSEKKFPALGTEAYDCNVSSLCSQLQKDYEEIIRDELRVSLATGTPLPSTQTFINRRRTIMTPIPTASNKFYSEFPSSQDKEVEKILHPKRKTYNFLSSLTDQLYPELSSDDDSDLGPFINGTIIKRNKNLQTSNVLKNKLIENANMELTSTDISKCLLDSERTEQNSLPRGKMNIKVLDNNVTTNGSFDSSSSSMAKTSSDNIYYKKTPKIKKSSVEKSLYSKEGDIVEDSLFKRKTMDLIDETNITNDCTNISDESKWKRVKNGSSTNMSCLELSRKSNELQILGKNICNINSKSFIAEKENIAINNLPNVISNIKEKSSSTNMSSLRVSLNNEICDSLSSNMSALLLLSESNQNITANLNNLKNDKSVSPLLLNNELTQKKTLQPQENCISNASFSPLNTDLVNNVLQMLEEETPPKDDNVTKRRKAKDQKKVTYNTRRKTMLLSDKSVESTNINNSSNGSQNHLHLKVKEKSDSIKKINKGKETKRQKQLRNSNSITDIQITPENKKQNYVPSTASKKKISKKNSNSKIRSESSSDEKRVNKTRKLYNPDASVKGIIVSDETEREFKRTNVNKRKSDEGVVFNSEIVTISPNTLLTTKAKEFVDQNNINIKDVLNKDSEESENEVKSKRRKIKKTNKQTSGNSEADEQLELAAEFVNKQNDKKVTKQSTVKKQVANKRRTSTRLSQYPRKKLNLSSSSSNEETDVVPVTPIINRRSTMEFQTKKQMNSTKKLKIDKSKHPSIVCTKLNKEDIQIFNQIVKKLGGFIIEDEVSSKTTHLVAGAPKRTINMLRAMTMGCWILKHEWLLRSLEEGKWLPEEDYEETDFSPAVQQCRLQHQAFGPSYTMNVFQDYGPIYVAKGSIPRCSDLKELISVCKGNVCSIPRNAAIIVGECLRYEGVKCVKETWVLDCITYNKKMPFKQYILTPSNSSPIV